LKLLNSSVNPDFFDSPNRTIKELKQKLTYGQRLYLAHSQSHH